MTRIGAIVLKAGYCAGYQNYLIIKENGGLRMAVFEHVGGNRYERAA